MEGAEGAEVSDGARWEMILSCQARYVFLFLNFPLPCLHFRLTSLFPHQRPTLTFAAGRRANADREVRHCRAFFFLPSALPSTRG